MRVWALTEEQRLRHEDDAHRRKEFFAWIRGWLLLIAVALSVVHFGQAVVDGNLDAVPFWDWRPPLP